MRARAAGLLALAALSLGATAAQWAPPPRVLDPTRPLTYFVAEGARRTGYRSGDRQLAEGALAAWHRGSSGRLAFEQAPETSALIRVYWVEGSEGQYGEMRPLSVQGRLGAAVYIRPDLEGLGDDLTRRAARDPLFRDVVVYLTCVHELGHALGLAHTRDAGDIMYFFGFGGDVGEYFARYRAAVRGRRDLATASPLSVADVTTLRTLYPPANP